jgi:hypothetical protein
MNEKRIAKRIDRRNVTRRRADVSRREAQAEIRLANRRPSHTASVTR